MKPKHWLVLVVAVTAVGVGVGIASAEDTAPGRTLIGRFCANPNALPKPMACIEASYGGETAQGYTGSTTRDIALRPGDYWLSVYDDMTAHNFSLKGPDGASTDITDVAGTPGWVTVKVHLTHGRWELYCIPHESFGMYVNLDVGGVGQVG
jgi:hypothetical protein